MLNANYATLAQSNDMRWKHRKRDLPPVFADIACTLQPNLLNGTYFTSFVSIKKPSSSGFTREDQPNDTAPPNKSRSSMFAFAATVPVYARSSIYSAKSPTASRPRVAHTTSRSAVLTMTAASEVASSSAAGAGDGDGDVRIRLHGNNISITNSLRDYVEAKMSKVFRKHTGLCSAVDVHLKVERNDAEAKNSAEVVMFCGKTIIRRQVRSIDSTCFPNKSFTLFGLSRSPQ
jgi:ribosomal subunit interface protein